MTHVKNAVVTALIALAAVAIASRVSAVGKVVFNRAA